MRVEIVGMIYQSVRYLDFMVDQLRRYCGRFPWRIVANDPTPEVKARLVALGVDYAIYRDPEPDLYYLRRVYRCVNWYYANSGADALIEVQSDMAYSPGWADELVNAWSPDNIPVSRLVQPFKVNVPGTYSLERDFGRPGDFRESEWIGYANAVRNSGEADGGFYCPRMIARDWFLSKGGFPEGNIAADGSLANSSAHVRAGDELFFSSSGKRHVTVCSSLVYHLQEGEMRDK